MDPPLELALDGQRTARLEITLDEKVAVFAGVSLVSGREAEDAEAVLNTLRGAVGARVEP